MNTFKNRPIARLIVLMAGSYAVIGGGLTLIGWVAKIPRFTDWDNDGISMMPNAALCAFMAGTALLLSTVSFRLAPGLIGGVVGLIGAATLFEHIAHVDLGIDQLVVAADWGQYGTLSPGRMGPPGSAAWTIIGITILLSQIGGRALRIAAWGGPAATAIAMLSILGYLFGAEELYTFPRATIIAMQTSTMILAIGVGLTAAVMEYGLGSFLSRQDTGGLLMRRLLVPIVLLPIVLGWARLAGQNAGLYDTRFGVAMLVLSFIFVMFVLLAWTAAGIGRTDKALRGSEARIRGIFETVVDGIITIDDHGKILDMNSATVRLFGYEREEMIGQNVSILMPEPYHAEHDSYLAHYRGTGERRIIGIGREVTGKRKDGTIFPLDLAVSESISGRQRTFTGVVRDITERKQSEEALRAADRRKEEFIATLAHELRNPLAPIANMLEVLKRAGTTGELALYARETIERQVTQIVRLVDDLLDVSRITRNKLELKREPVELAFAVKQALEMCQPMVERFSHSLNLDLPADPVFLDADPTRLSQVFGNLVSNACKFTPVGGKIDVKAERENGDVLVRVRDNGVGIPPAELANVFDMFAQVQRPVDERYGGLGIGLTLTKQLVEMHSGSIEARSEGDGRGTEFVVRLPVLEMPQIRSVESVDRSMPTVAGRRILVVDDNFDSAESMSMLLTIQGNQCQMAHNGESAIELVRSFSPHIVLLDIGLPGIDGYEVCRSIRKDGQGQNILIIAMTGWGQPEDRRRTAEAGFDEHLVKPIDINKLNEILVSASRGRIVVN